MRGVFRELSYIGLREIPLYVELLVVPAYDGQVCVEAGPCEIVEHPFGVVFRTGSAFHGPQPPDHLVKREAFHIILQGFVVVPEVAVSFYPVRQQHKHSAEFVIWRGFHTALLPGLDFAAEFLRVYVVLFHKFVSFNNSYSVL